jgi:predicted kinase
MLIVLGGMPGVGKSTIARQLCRDLPAAWLRIDTIEQTLRNTGLKIWAEGYEVAYALAAENLKAGATVVADCVNPLPITRNAWAAVAARTGARLLQLELFCSDQAAHRRRVETRVADIPGHRIPTWADVQTHEYEPWDRPIPRLDTAGRTPEAVITAVHAILKKK